VLQCVAVCCSVLQSVPGCVIIGSPSNFAHAYTYTHTYTKKSVHTHRDVFSHTYTRTIRISMEKPALAISTSYIATHCNMLQHSGRTIRISMENTGLFGGYRGLFRKRRVVMRRYRALLLSSPAGAEHETKHAIVLQFVAGCCSVLQCVAVCCSVLQCVAMCGSVFRYRAEE